MRFAIIFAAMLLVALGWGIIAKQKRAKNCPRHNRWAGYVALLLAYGCLVGGVGLLIFAIWFAVP